MRSGPISVKTMALPLGSTSGHIASESVGTMSSGFPPSPETRQIPPLPPKTIWLSVPQDPPCVRFVAVHNGTGSPASNETFFS